MSARFIGLGGSFLFLGVLSIFAAEQAPPAINKSAEDFERLAKVFALPEDSKLIGKPWVVVETGPANWFPIELEGWRIEDAAHEIVVLDWYGEIHTLRKPGPKEEQPELEEKDGYIYWDDLPGANGTVAWKIRREDYHAKSKKFLADGLPKKEERQQSFSSMNERFALRGHVVDAARHAHFAQYFGRKEHAEKLYTHALIAYKKYADAYLGGYEQAEELPIFVAKTIASGKINWAISCGHRGTPRKELKEQWETIAALPYHEHQGEAKRMAAHYQNLLKEDARWIEPDPEAFAKFTSEQKVAYWIYHLRDLDIGQQFFPGHCHVAGPLAGSRNGKKPNPAAELEKLGMAAVPQLIAHLDDARPTRCKAAWRYYWPEGHYLLRYGDCCQQIFESITGEKITEPGRYPIRDGIAKECKENAESWWREYQKKNRKGED